MNSETLKNLKLKLLKQSDELVDADLFDNSELGRELDLMHEKFTDEMVKVIDRAVSIGEAYHAHKKESKNVVQSDINTITDIVLKVPASVLEEANSIAKAQRIKYIIETCSREVVGIMEYFMEGDISITRTNARLVGAINSALVQYHEVLLDGGEND